MCKLKSILKDRRGSGLIDAIGLALAFFVISALVIECIRLNNTAYLVRNEIRTATIETCAKQYPSVYNGIREGYSGGYTISNGHWSTSLSSEDIYNWIDSTSGTRKEGDQHIKYAGTSVDYYISGLTASITNAPFAPSGAGAAQLTCTAKVDLYVPLILHWNGVPPMHKQVYVKAGYSPIF